MSIGQSQFPHESRESGFRPQSELSTRELLQQLAEDTRSLIRDEIKLARLEVQEKLDSLKHFAAAIAAGVALLALAGLAFAAFLVLGLGALLGGAFWLSALIIGIVFAAIGGLLAIVGLKKVSARKLTPQRTIRSLQDDRQWLKDEAQNFRDDLAS